MSIIPNFNTIKCDKCDSNGFIVGESSAVKCNCRIRYEQELKTSDVLSRSGLLNENSTYEDFKKLIDFDWSDYRGKDENGNLKKLRKFVDEFDKTKYKEIPHNSVDDKGNIIRTEYSKVSIENPFKHLHCYVWGGQGTQKSYTMKGVLTKLATKGKSVYYIFAKDLISLLHDSERDEELKKKLDYIKNVDVLVIDEFEEQRCCLWQSGYKERLLIVWLKERLEVVRKSTWFISNDSMEEQKESKFGELFGDMLDRETKFGRFEFKDKYSDYITKEEIEETMKNIWDD
jgi:DNA replication protein DnaC